MFKIITIGDALIDTHVKIDDATVNCDINHEHCHLCLDYASKVPITDSFQNLGGNAANVACGTARLGLETAILTTLGGDSNGELVQEELKKFGVDTTLISVDSKAKTRYSVVLNFKGERTILSYHAARRYAWPKNFPECDWTYYTGMSEGYETVQKNLTDWLKKHPTVRVAMNPGSYQLKNALDSVREFLTHTDILIVNLQEAELIASTTIKKEKTVAALIHKLLKLGAKEIVITDAEKGAWAGDEENIWHLDSFPVPVIAKTGAGDAFSAGYLSARALGHDNATALQWGIANSCGVIQQFGAQNGLLDKKGIEKMIQKFGETKPELV